MRIGLNKIELLKIIHKSSRSNFFSIEIPKATKDDEKKIDELVEELQKEGKIKLRAYVQREYSVYLNGILKYASE